MHMAEITVCIYFKMIMIHNAVFINNNDNQIKKDFQTLPAFNKPQLQPDKYNIFDYHLTVVLWL